MLSCELARSGGLFFRPASGFHYAMDAGLENVIRRALADARAAGRDRLTQTEEAVRAGREARPDMTASEILAAVRMLQRSRSPTWTFSL